MAKTVAFFGLGNMGGPMAANLVKAGFQVRAFDVVPASVQQAVQDGCSAAASEQAAVEGADVVISMLPDGAIAERLYIDGAGLLNLIGPATLVIDCSTIAAASSRRIAAEGKKRGIRVVDAPVSGGQAGAENGQLSVMCGGAQADYAAAEPLIAAYARICRRMGDSGAGQLAKMCNQIAIAGLVQGLAESLNFAQRAGLSIPELVEVISQGAAGSWQMQNRHATMAEGRYDFGFAVDWMRKDLGICLKTGDEIGAALPVTALVDQFYKDVQLMGGGRWDTSSLLARLKG